MRIEQQEKLDFNDVLLKPKRSLLTGRQDIELEREYKFLHSSHVYKGIPVMASNMDGVGTFSMARALGAHKMFCVIKKHYTIDDWRMQAPSLDFEHIAVSTGTNALWNKDAEDYKLVHEVTNEFPVNFICIDVANGYTQNFIDFIKKVRDDYPEKVIIAGNVITPEMVEELLINGVDIVKCGIGGGSSCTTRLVAGVGFPQLSGVDECSDAAHGIGGHIISDGGCVYPGDVSKAFAAGADFVMLGGMLAGYNQSEQEVITKANGDKVILFYGMSSKEAVKRHGTRKDGYKTTEGRVVELPYRGDVEEQVNEILGGIISTCAYIGAKRIKDISKCATFVKVVGQKTYNQVYEHFTI